MVKQTTITCYILLIFLLVNNVCTQCSDAKKVTNMNVKEKEMGIPPTEDLMREHGILNRVLLIYEEIIKRAETNNEFPLEALNDALSIIRDFIENYHEHLEEKYIFPLFKKHNKELSLIQTLMDQHDQGRIITQTIQKRATPQAINIESNKREIAVLLKKFIDMYRPHEAREDTELFPQVRSLMSEQEFEKLGELFEDTEHEIFGPEGFEGILKRVETIEKSLDIYNLDKFTPAN